MTFWDFVGLAFVWLGTWTLQNWLVLFIVAALLTLFGWLFSEAIHAPYDDEMSESEKDAHKGWIKAQYLTPDEMELLADFRSHPDVAWARGEVRIDNPS